VRLQAVRGGRPLIACLLKNEPASYSVSQLKAVEGRRRSESESEKGDGGTE
jgi:hypothetical protein